MIIIKKINKGNKNRVYLKYFLITLITCFLLLALFIILAPPSIFDQWFSLEVQEHHNLFLDRVMVAISYFGERKISIIIVVLVSMMFLVANYKKEAIFIFFTLTSGIISSVAKYLINRPRPTVNLVRIIDENLQQSFPSGHVTFYMAFFGFLIFLMYRLKEINFYIRIIVTLISLVLILSVSFSRIYLGAHWLTDVIGGYLLGGIILYTLGYFYLRSKNKTKIRS